MTSFNPADLIQACLDDEASPAERAALDGLLTADPAMREEYERLRRTVALLEDLPDHAPPPGLAAAIAARARVLPARGGHLPAGPMMRYAASFAAGAVLAVLGSQLGGTPVGEHDVGALVGTMATPEATRGPTVTQRPGLPGVPGTLTLRRSEGLLVLSVNLQSDQALEMVLPLSDTLEVVGVLALGATRPTFVLENDHLRVQQAGHQGYAVLLRGQASAVPYELRQGETVLHQGAIAAPDAGDAG